MILLILAKIKYVIKNATRVLVNNVLKSKKK